MKISEAIKELNYIKDKHGDLNIIGGAISEDTPPKQFTVLDNIGANIDFGYTYKGECGEDVPNPIDGVFIE